MTVVIKSPAGTSYEFANYDDAQNFLAKQLPGHGFTLPTRAEQQALTPRDHCLIREVDPDYPPDPPPAEDKAAFAAWAKAQREAWEKRWTRQPLTESKS